MDFKVSRRFKNDDGDFEKYLSVTRDCMASIVVYGCI